MTRFPYNFIHLPSVSRVKLAKYMAKKKNSRPWHAVQSISVAMLQVCFRPSALTGPEWQRVQSAKEGSLGA